MPCCLYAFSIVFQFFILLLAIGRFIRATFETKPVQMRSPVLIFTLGEQLQAGICLAIENIIANSDENLQ
jgi:hypothetical protein